MVWVGEITRLSRCCQSVVAGDWLSIGAPLFALIHVWILDLFHRLAPTGVRERTPDAGCLFVFSCCCRVAAWAALLMVRLYKTGRPLNTETQRGTEKN